jgi:23S rRNA (guanosine2251-2'-O)-methyltransferase
MGRRRTEYIYGINPSFEVVRAGRRRISGAYISESSSGNPRIKKLLHVFEKYQVPVEWVDKRRVMDLSGSKEHQGVVLKTATYPYAKFEDLIGQSRWLLLDNVEDPHNVGAILRSADIFGFQAVLMPVKGVPEIYPSVVKVSAGASEFLQICREMSSNAYVRKAREHGYRVIALDAAGKTEPGVIAAADPGRMLLVIGGENRSVGQFILNQADDVVGIPQHGRINSLNASVAAGIAMYALAGRG